MVLIINLLFFFQGSSVGGSFSTQQDRSPVHQDTSPTPPHMEPTTLSKTVGNHIYY